VDKKEYRIVSGVKDGMDFDLIMFTLYRHLEDKNLKSSTQRIYRFLSRGTVYVTWEKEDVMLKKLPQIRIEGERPESIMWTVGDHATEKGVKLKLEKI